MENELEDLKVKNEMLLKSLKEKEIELEELNIENEMKDAIVSKMRKESWSQCGEQGIFQAQNKESCDTQYNNEEFKAAIKEKEKNIAYGNYSAQFH